VRAGEVERATPILVAARLDLTSFEQYVWFSFRLLAGLTVGHVRVSAAALSSRASLRGLLMA
jgi:hypothetical protein